MSFSSATSVHTAQPGRGLRGSRFRIGVNLTWLVPGVVGGSEEYTMRLLDAVGPLLDDRIELRLYARDELIERYPELTSRYRTIRCPSVASKPARVVMEQTWLARASGGDDLIHHAGGTVPYVRLRPGIVTIHDLQPLEMPENFDPIKRRWLHHALPYAVRAARLVLCPSQFTADRLRDLLGVDPSRIRVVLHGHHAELPSTNGADPGSDSDGGSAPDLDPARFGRFVLYPAIAYPHKRHRDVVRAVARLGPGFDDVSVVFTGRSGPELESVLSDASRLGIGGRVHALGRIPAADLDRLYRAAAALVFPSAYEGFGNPALEAMSTGCPVVAADGGALPEVVGDAGLLCPVGDVGAFSGAIESILAGGDDVEAMVERGVKRAALFAPGIAAERLAAVYAELADSTAF